MQENGDIRYEVKYQGMRPRWVSEKRLAQDDFKKLVEFREQHEIEDTRKHAARQPQQRSDAERRAIGERLDMKASEQEFKYINALDSSEE